MRRRIRFVRVLKWAGTIVCVVIIAAFLASGRYMAVYSFGHTIAGSIVQGTLVLYYSFDPRLWWDWLPRGYESFDLGEFTINGFNWWNFGWRLEHPRVGVISMPLWLPLLVTLIPTLLLWNLDRRVPPGHCRKCRYNMAGNTTGRCPECGAAFAPAAR